ncbi:cytochrome c biogenesis protein ResB [Shouchella shacheensis]|uniref:cytochrome c biogenesis protein ResB n=1 Tax=Shouchella shacheensis TaxID=1649580 RepID=UPI00073FC4FE|nr:cytochrome c biogenesis protein ResB [Shouchella shacheensis]
MKTITCECGHENKEGTDICAACGKPLTKQDSNELLNMRYEGAAIRSFKKKRSLLDRIWGFFSSVKIGITIIVILLLASAMGTVFPQRQYIPPLEDPAVYYGREYGSLGELYYQLGFHEMYSSWWYMLLIAALGVSIIVASFDRGVPLYKALKAQRVTRHKHFLSRQRLFGKTALDQPDEAMEQVATRLKGKRYKLRYEGGNILAEKNRFARWGPYVNHVGLILFLTGCMLRFLPGMHVDTQMWVRDGESSIVPETNSEYVVENELFTVDLYDEDDERFQDAFEQTEGPVVETFQTDAILYKRSEAGAIGDEGELEEVDRKEIRVNDPMQFEGFSLYQTDYKLNELNRMTFTLENKETEETFGEMTIDLLDPQASYDMGDGYRVEVEDYFPDFYMNEANEPATRSRVPNNPFFTFRMTTPETPEGETSFVGIQQNLEPLGENEYKMTFMDVEMKNVSILTVRKDSTIPLLIAGGVIFMIGLVQGSYWAHRRVWIQRVDGEVWLAGHTNRNWMSLHKEVNGAVEGTGISSPEDMDDKKNAGRSQSNET